MIDLITSAGLTHFIFNRDLSWIGSFGLATCPFCQGFWTGVLYFTGMGLYNSSFSLLNSVTFAFASAIVYQAFYMMYESWQEGV